MPEPRNFGEFFDALLEAIRKAGNIEAESFIEDWTDLFSDDEWQKKRDMLLNEEMVLVFADDMARMIWARIVGICTEALYNSSLKSGHDFLRQMQEVSKVLGLAIRSPDRALSPTEWVSVVK